MSGARPSSPRSGRAGSRPGRPGQRPSAGRQRAASSARTPARPRFTGRAAVLVLVLAVLVVSYASSMRAYLQQRAELNSLNHNIHTSQTRIAALEREQKRWKDPAYLRAQARERFGWVLPGEVGLQVIGPNGKPMGHSDTLSAPATAHGSQQPLWWQSAWGSVVAAGTPKLKKHVPTPVTEIRPKSSRQ